MTRVGTQPLDAEAPDLLETCFSAFCESPWISIPVYIFGFSLLGGLAGVYIWMNHSVYIGLGVVVFAIVVCGTCLYVLAMRGSHNTRAVQSTDRADLPRHIQPPTTVVTWSRFRQRVDIDLGSRSTSSSTSTADFTEDILDDLSDLSDDPDVSGSSGLQQPTIAIPDDHFSRTLRSGKKTPGVISPRSERPKALKEPAARESPGRSSNVSEVASSPSQSSVKSIGKRKKISTRRLSIHEEHSPYGSMSLSD